MSKKIFFLLCVFVPSFLWAGGFHEVLKEKAVRPGLCVVVGCETSESLIRAALDGKFIVQGLCADPRKAAMIRKELIDQGAYGDVSVAPMDVAELPYIDHLVNVVVLVNKGEVTRKDVMRVVAPFGVVVYKKGGAWRKAVKPYPKEMNDWPMFAHDLGRSNVLMDKVVKVPSGLQWVTGNPMAAYMVNQAVTSDGRIFYSRSRGMKRKKEETKGLLEARDAYNGILLWRKELKRGHAWNRSCLAVEGERLYAVVDKALVALDVATGEVVQDYGELDDSASLAIVGDRLVVGKGTAVYDIKSGERLWNKRLGAYGDACLVDKGRIFTTDKNIVVSLDLETGEENWRVDLGGRVNLGSVWQFDASDGAKVAKVKLSSVPRFDGLAIAGGDLFISTKKGQVICLEGK